MGYDDWCTTKADCEAMGIAAKEGEDCRKVYSSASIMVPSVAVIFAILALL